MSLDSRVQRASAQVDVAAVGLIPDQMDIETELLEEAGRNGRRRAVGVTVVGDELHVHVRMRLDVQIGHRQADRVDPDLDRAGGLP